MTKLYLIRHAEAEGNLYRRIQGHYNSLLTENGYRQVEALKARFADTHIDAVYSSDLFRTMETAKAIYLPKGLTLQTRSDLRELNMGEWEDRTWGQVALEQPEQMRKFTRGMPDWQVENAETFAQLQQRVGDALLDIAKAHDGQTVAVFSHGMAIRYSCGRFMGLSLEECHSIAHNDNTAVTLLEIGGGQVNIIFEGDASHLSEEISTIAKQGWWKNKEETSPNENIWYQSADLRSMACQDLYLSSRRESWMSLGRDLHYLEAQDYMPKATSAWQADPRNLVMAQRVNTTVGILQLAPEIGAEEGAGYISFLYTLPEYRSMGYGVQMLGQAISVYRPLGRKTLRLACGEDNPAGLAFYQRHGFRKIREKKTEFTTLHILEKNISYEQG